MSCYLKSCKAVADTGGSHGATVHPCKNAPPPEAKLLSPEGGEASGMNYEKQIDYQVQ